MTYWGTSNLSETTDAQKKMRGYFQIKGGGKNVQPRILHPIKLFFKAESERKPSSDEGKHTCTTRNTF